MKKSKQDYIEEYEETYEEEYEEADVEDIDLQYYDKDKTIDNTVSKTASDDYGYELKQIIQPKISLKECPNKNI